MLRVGLEKAEIGLPATQTWRGAIVDTVGAFAEDEKGARSQATKL